MTGIALAPLSTQIQATAVHQAAPATDVKRALAEVLTRPEFKNVRTPWWEQFLGTLQDWYAQVVHLMGKWSARLDIPEPLLWLLVGIALLVTGVAVWYGFFLFRRNWVDERSADGGQAVHNRNHLLSADEWFAKGRQAQQKGDLSSAVRFVYLASLAHLEAADVLRIRQHMTPRDLLRAARNLSSAHYAALADLTALFERAWYGHHPSETTDWASACALFEKLRYVSSSLATSASAPLLPSEGGTHS